MALNWASGVVRAHSHSRANGHISQRLPAHQLGRFCIRASCPIYSKNFDPHQPLPWVRQQAPDQHRQTRGPGMFMGGGQPMVARLPFLSPDH